MKVFVCYKNIDDVKNKFYESDIFQKLTDDQFTQLKNYSLDDSRQEFIEYLGNNKNNARIATINNLSELSNMISRLSDPICGTSGWGALLGFDNAPLNCDAYAIVD